MAESKVIIDDYQVDKKTGHILMRVHTHTVDGNAQWDGPQADYSFSLQIFRDKFAGDISQMEAHVGRMHRSICGPPRGLEDALLKRKGKVIA